MNVAEYLIKNLEKLGVNHFFGLPGDYNFNIVYAVENNSKTHWIGCTNELNAGYAADGYAREKGFGAVITTYGVGELSAINAVAGSYAENVPIINIVGAPSTNILESKKIFHHNFQNPEAKSFMKAFDEVTETSAFLNRDNAKLEIDRILKVFVKERKPVYIAIPADIAVSRINDREVDYDWISDENTLETVVKLIVDKVNNSSNPVILADTLIKRFGAKDEFIKFVEATGIPVTNFLMGADIIDSDYDKYLGTYLSTFGNHKAAKALDTTDCLIAVGAIYGDVNSFGTNIPYDIDSHIAIYGTYTYINGQKYDNVKMSDILKKAAASIHHKEYRFDSQNTGYNPPDKTSNKIDAQYLYPKIQEFLQEGDIIYADTGIIPYGLANMKLSKNMELNTQLLWCSIGWAIPAAFGAGIAKPDSRILILTGDGAHQVSAMEVGSMCRYGVKSIIIVLNNGGYAIERALSGNPNHSMNDIAQMDYTKFARAFKGDMWSTKVETADDFDKALRVTQIMNKLCYIEVILEKEDMPKVAREVLSKLREIGIAENKEAEKGKEYNKGDIEDLENSDARFETQIHTVLKI